MHIGVVGDNGKECLPGYECFQIQVYIKRNLYIYIHLAAIFASVLLPCT